MIESRAKQDRSLQFRPHQVCPGQVGSRQVGATQIGTGQVGAGQVAVDESRAAQGAARSEPFAGTSLLDECLDLIASAKKRRRAAGWVGRFTRIKNLRHRAAEGLCRRGILRDAEDKILLVFTRKIYPTIDPVPERRIVERLRNAIVGSSTDIDSNTALLVALAHPTGLLGVHFEKKKLRARKARIEKITSGELVGKATREAVRAAQQAAMVAVTAATTAATTAVTATR